MSLVDKASGSAMKSGSQLWCWRHADIDLVEAHISGHRPSKLPFTAKQEATHFRVSWSIEGDQKETNEPKSNTSRLASIGSASSCRIGDRFL
jgi:hypothetical protein